MKQSPAFPLGMTSVTFRKKSIAEAAALAHAAELSLIEWGADVHVPPGDTKAIRDACDAMAKYGLACSSYGTYYRLGMRDFEAFGIICESAKELGAHVVRTWLGTHGSADTTPAEQHALLDEAVMLATIAARHDLILAFEFHGKTFNDTGASSAAFLEAIRRESPSLPIQTYWQPLAFGDSAENLRAVLPNLVAVHVFQWDRETRRYPLASGIPEWRTYLSILRENKVCVPLILEFVANDDAEQFLQDASTLHELANT